MLKEGQHWATSYALKADELYTSFPTKKYMSMKAKELPARFNGDFKVMYGEMFNAKMDIWEKEPPVRVFKKPKPVCIVIQYWKYSLSTSGTGS